MKEGHAGMKSIEGREGKIGDDAREGDKGERSEGEEMERGRRIGQSACWLKRAPRKLNKPGEVGNGMIDTGSL